MNASLFNVRHPSDGMKNPVSREPRLACSPFVGMSHPAASSVSRVSCHVSRSAPQGFTVLELLVATALLTVIMGMLFSIFGKMSDAWIYSESNVDRQRTSRTALELLNRELSQAMITTNASNPIRFEGSSNWVYFVAPVQPFTNQVSDLAEFAYNYVSASTNFQRFYVDPSIVNQGSSAWNPYNRSAITPTAPLPSLSTPSIVAENVLYLQLQYYDASGTPNSTWDSATPGPTQNILPSVIEVTMLVMDSRSARKAHSTMNILQNARTNTAVIHLSNAP